MKKFVSVYHLPILEDGAVVMINGTKYEVSDEEYSFLRELRQKTGFQFKEILFFDWINEKTQIIEL